LRFEICSYGNVKACNEGHGFSRAVVACVDQGFSVRENLPIAK
jgi:hypothetical protein